MFKSIKYYARKDIQKALLEQSPSKEVGVRYKEIFGKRPDILQFENDIFEFVKKGATSFHISEEIWNDPMELSTGLTKKQLDDQRKGWDLILDIDCAYWDYSKLTAYLLVEALKFHNLKNLSAKFSGNKGFHIGVPFEAFPDEVNGKKTKDLYPEGLRVIAAYLQEMIRPMLIKKILEKENIRTISKKTGKTEQDLTKNGEFDPFTVIDIDTILISSRHLYRSAYSLHEKTGLASLPINPNTILTFEKESAETERVRPEIKFLDRTEIKDKEAKELIIQAFDWHSKQTMKKSYAQETEQKSEKKGYTPYETKNAITEEKFPPCIKKIISGNMADGKKRALFILLRFLKNVGWSQEAIEQKIKEWNNTNPSPLSESYIITQNMWHKRQNNTILPPNCTNESYYKELQLCPENCVCRNYKNPVNFTIRQAQNEEMTKKLKTKVKKSNPSASQASQ